MRTTLKKFSVSLFLISEGFYSLWKISNVEKQIEENKNHLQFYNPISMKLVYILLGF